MLQLKVWEAYLKCVEESEADDDDDDDALLLQNNIILINLYRLTLSMLIQLFLVLAASKTKSFHSQFLMSVSKVLYWHPDHVLKISMRSK